MSTHIFNLGDLSNFEEEHFNKSIKYFGKNRDDSYMVLLKN